ncbi:hypothetical protein DACRYDRAFT_118380 [Dacryopinax primogenitus]|uniref:Uncharacterized protein n=1 Tax=Dacryopinax primogenitus (strain DJM 731) TaxID=1858805 RepID=M5FUG2_DACPD|nr:uncharacterized protein DACRYDRAFT_118380 [Dacryopinax primogenitus]EJT99114.1 hypothetical protein DACRYDRAFT_118380 [Dacryopinax primogenitus]
MDGSACDERLGGMWWQGQQKLVSVLGEWSQFRRPLRINSISQLWVPTIRKIMSYQRIRPSTMQVTYFTRWVLPPQAEVLRVDDDEEAGWVEREMGMRLGRLTRREVGELSGPLRQTPRYITHGLAFSSVARPLSPSSSSASSVLYGASTLNTDLSLTSPLLLPSYAFSPLPQILLGRTARAVYRSLTQTRDEHGQSKTALSSLLPQSLPLHAKIPISDRATAAVLRASGWKEVFGGVADVFLDGWTDTPEEEYQEQKAEKRTGMTRAQREELGERRKRQAEENWRLAQEDREIEQGLAPGGDGARGVMQRRERMRVGMSGVFSHPDKIDTWDV